MKGINLDVQITFGEMLSMHKHKPLVILLPPEEIGTEIKYTFKEVIIPMSLSTIDWYMENEFVDFMYYISDYIDFRKGDGNESLFNQFDLGTVKEEGEEQTVYTDLVLVYKYK